MNWFWDPIELINTIWAFIKAGEAMDLIAAVAILSIGFCIIMAGFYTIQDAREVCAKEHRRGEGE